MISEQLQATILVVGAVLAGMVVYHNAVGLVTWQGFEGQDVHGCRVVLARAVAR